MRVPSGKNTILPAAQATHEHMHIAAPDNMERGQLCVLYYNFLEYIYSKVEPLAVA